MEKHRIKLFNDEVIEIEGRIKLLEDKTTPECIGNACDCFNYKVNNNRTLTISNGCDTKIIIKIEWGSYNKCEKFDEVNLGPFETMELRFPDDPNIVGVCLPVQAIKM